MVEGAKTLAHRGIWPSCRHNYRQTRRAQSLFNLQSTRGRRAEDRHMNDRAGLDKFAQRYARTWCSQDPESVAAFFAENGSLKVNGGTPAVGRAAIAEVARGFMRDF